MSVIEKAARPIHAPAALFAGHRIGAMILRHLYTLRRSKLRVLELMYWPTMQLFLWGFISTFFIEHSSWLARAGGVLISAVLLWDVLFRANLGVALSFIEEMWSRNLGSLFVTPLRPVELIAALIIMSLVRTTIAVAPAAVLALPLFGTWAFSLGPPLAAFYFNLLFMGCSVGLLASALVLRFGLAAESICWLGIFLMAPVACIYYPVETLPAWLQWLAWSLPAAHVFEGMRAVLFDGAFRWDLFAAASGLNLLYLGLSAGFFLRMFRVARERGLLLQQGE